MPRHARRCPGGLAYHVLNRGNGGGRIFHCDADYAHMGTVTPTDSLEPAGARGDDGGGGGAEARNRDIHRFQGEREPKASN